MRISAPSKADLERGLLRRGVVGLAAGRRHCGSCDRTPLLGEQVFLYEGGRMLCALCRDGRRDAPVRSEPVRSPEWGRAVRPAAA